MADTILKTSDYGFFKSLPHNRPVVQSHVSRLAQSMADKPHLRPARPVLVNDKHQVIDGQHRLAASQANDQEVYYMIVEGLTIDDARQLNALQRTWSLLDYAYSYASSKVPAYVQFVKTYEAHELPPSIVMENMLSGSHKQHEFRTGLMQKVDQAWLDAILDQTEEIVALFPKAATPYIVAAAYRAAQHADGFDHQRMVKKAERAKPQAQPDRVSYIRELERTYNLDVPFDGPSYLRFF